MVQIFDQTNIETLSFPETEDGTYAKNFLLPFIKHGPKHFIDNANTEMHAIKVDDHILPITVTDEIDNSFVCSLYAQYVLYPSDEFKLHEKGFFNKISSTLLKLYGKILQFGKVHKVVFVNNWLVSTNLYPNLTEEQVKKIRDRLIKLYPNYAIAFRSVNEKTMPKTSEALKKNDFNMLMSRPVYIMDTTTPEPFKARMFKSDLKILQKTQYEVIDSSHLTSQDSKRIASLYQALNLDKYSSLNPQFNERFIDLAIKSNVLDFKAFRKDGQIDGILGYYHRNGIMTSPFFGYDLDKNDMGLYRMISTQLTLDAQEKNCVLHASSGASSYKKLRRAKPTFEYTAVYTKHLPLYQRLIWAKVKLAANGIGKTLLKFYEP